MTAYDSRLAGKPGLLISILILLAAAVCSLCFPHATLMAMHPIAATVVDLSGVLITALILIFLNKRQNILHTAALNYATVFILLSATFPGTFFRGDSGTLAALISSICLSLLFSGGERPERRETILNFFVIASTLSLVSMWEYALLLTTPAYIIGLFMLNRLHFREFAAFAIGLVAPYWCALGLGLIDVDSLRMIIPSSIFNFDFTGKHTFLMITSGGITVVLTLMLIMGAATNAWPMSSATRRFISALNALAIWCMILMIVDFTNFPVYTAIIFIPTSMLAALMLKSASPGANALLLGIITLVYGAVFTLYLL